jgi:tetratricopeptide (TPR) repeat protein
MAKLKPNAETFRIRALAHFVAKDLGQARLEIRKALELQPHWESIRFTSAVINYFSGISVAALPNRPLSWPEPVTWALVKCDDESITRFREAEKVFKELAEKYNKKDDKRQSMESWRLACLANDPDRQAEAISYCKEILKTNRTHYRAIAWALTRNFEVDLKRSEKGLIKLVKNHEAEISHILAVVSYYLSSQKAKKALKLLNDTKPLFKKQKSEVLWTFWRVQSLVASGNSKAALRVIDKSESKEELQQVRAATLHSIVKVTGEWQQLTEHLERSYEDTGDSRFLLEICGLMASYKNWGYVADRAKKLVEELGTGEALRLAAIASYNDKRFDLCLRLLDDHRDFFSENKLPYELRRLRASAQQALGMLPEAISEGEVLLREDPTTENLLTLASLYFEKGDLKGLAIISRQLADRTDLSPAHSLQIARLIHWEDLELATSLWRKGVSQGLPDSSVTEAVALGYQLGLDNELGPLFVRMTELGTTGRGGIQIVKIEDLKSMVKRQYDRGIELDKFYKSGAVPIHLIAEERRLPLVNLYHELLRKNESAPDPRRQFSLLARHGGRTLMQKFPDGLPKWRLHLDVTALLLAAHIDILDLVERVFKPLRIPGDLIPALIAMRDRVTSHQPSRIRDFQQIIDLADRGSLVAVTSDLPCKYENAQLTEEMGEDWVGLFEKAREEGGYLVDFLPLRKKDLTGSPSVLPEDANRYIVNCRAVVEALRREGPLSAEEYAAALNALGNNGKEDPSGTIPQEGSALFCRGNIPEVLASATLLHIACDRFKLRMERSELDIARAEMKEHEERRTLSDWVGDLIGRVRKGIDTGAYEILPSSIDEEVKSDKTLPEGLEYKCLLALLRFQAREGDVLWMDDRSLTSYLRRDTVPIIGINEMLQALVSANALDMTSYYSKLSRLRASNVWFIPVQKDEILHYLRQAKVENNVVIETGELIILRRYVAACLLGRNVLQHPPMPKGAPNENGEIAFIVGLVRAIIDALVELWAETDNENTCEARAEWILSNLYIDHLGLFNTAGFQRSEQDERYLVALTLGGLISQAITLKSTSVGEEPSPRRIFCQWLFNRILRKRFEADPLLVASVADILKKTIISSCDEMLKKESKGVMIRVLQLFYKDLPDVLRSELGRDSDFMSTIGMKFMTAITIGNWTFNPEEFWKAASEAINGRESKIRPIESAVELAFRCLAGPDRGSAFSITDSLVGKINIVKKAELQLLLDSPAERESVLRRNRHWFDCPSETFDKAVAEIASMEDPRRRIETTESWQKLSAHVFYANLHQKLQQRNEMQPNDLLPTDVESLVRFLRINPEVGSGAAFQVFLATVTEKLIHEEGLIPALNRFIGLPVGLPPPFLQAFADLPRERREATIKKLLRNASSPISKIHFLHILMHFGEEVPAYYRLTRRYIKGLFSLKGLEEFEAFLAILKWTNDRFTNWSKTQGWSPQIRLALVWTHAHQLYSIFASIGAPAPWIRDAFIQMWQRIPLEVFERDTNYWLDISHPWKLHRINFLLTGLCYILGEKIESFIDQDLRQLFVSMAFLETDGGRVPTPALLKDTAQAKNSMGAFLNKDYMRALKELLGYEESENLAESSLRKIAENALTKLATTYDDFSSWMLLESVLGDFPPHKNMEEMVKSVILRSDFSTIFQKSPRNGALAMMTASKQSLNLKDKDLAGHLKDDLAKIIGFLSREGLQSSADNTGGGVSNEIEEAGLLLLESILNLSLGAQDPVREFVELISQILENWRPIIPTYRPAIQRFCEELPVNQAGQFWPLLVRLRAE